MFEESLEKRVESWENSKELKKVAQTFTGAALRAGYTYNFEWLGGKIIQFPEDIVNMQQIIFKTRPNIIIETGVAHGGSSLFYTSIMHLNALYHQELPAFKYIGIDISINQRANELIKASPFRNRINLLECDSTKDGLTDQIRNMLNKDDKIMVVLDSCHTTEHVAREIENIGCLTSPGCYLVICDTSVGVVGPAYENCRYGVDKNNSPLQAAKNLSQEFEEDKILHMSQLASSNFQGFYIKK